MQGRWRGLRRRVSLAPDVANAVWCRGRVLQREHVHAVVGRKGEESIGKPQSSALSLGLTEIAADTREGVRSQGSTINKGAGFHLAHPTRAVTT